MIVIVAGNFCDNDGVSNFDTFSSRISYRNIYEASLAIFFV